MAPFAITISQEHECLAFARDLLAKYLWLCLGDRRPQPVSFTLRYAPDGDRSAELSPIVKENGFLWCSEGRSVTFAAKTPLGVLDAVVTYLEEEVGVRFYTADCEHCPPISEIPLPSFRVVNPPFAMRTYLSGDCYDDTRAEGYASPKLDFLSKSHVFDVFTEIDRKHGGPVPFYGRHIHHNFRLYCPFETYGSRHPEWYQDIVVNEEAMRTIDITNGIAEDGSIDETKEESVVKTVIAELKKDVLAHPHVSVFSLTQEDGDAYFDDENNRRLTERYGRGGILLRFVNAVVREVHGWAKRELGRDIKIMTFAYAYAAKAPVIHESGLPRPIDASVVADENLIVQLALFRNGLYSYFSPHQEEATRQSLCEWKCVARHFWVWIYDADFANYFAYYDSLHAIPEDVRGFLSYGADYLCVNGAYDSESCWQSNLRGYLYRRLMWNPNLDFMALLEDYLTHYYGPAAPHVRSVIERFHDRYQSRAEAGEDVCCGTWGSCSSRANNPEDFLSGILDLLDEAEAEVRSASLSAAESAVLLRRLRQVRCTPLCLAYLSDRDDPNASERKREQSRQAFAACAAEAAINRPRERFDMPRFLSFVESDDYLGHPVTHGWRTLPAGKERR